MTASTTGCRHCNGKGYLKARYAWPFWMGGVIATAILIRDDALSNSISPIIFFGLYPLLLWATRQMDDRRATAERR